MSACCLTIEQLETRALPSAIFPGTLAFPDGLGQFAVAAGDFNNDGNLDLAAANNSVGSISILLGNGTGAFSAPVNYLVGGGAASFAVGDLNGDGKMDLVVGTAQPNGVSVLLGNGNGTFGAPTNYALPFFPSSVAVGDFTGDGHLDVAAGLAATNSAVDIFLGDGSGRLSAPVSYPIGSGRDSVVAGDFNGDGKLDLAVASYASMSVGILLGNGDGTFAVAASYSVSLFPWAETVGDFNGDGKLDLAVAGDAGPAATVVTVLLGNGDGTFAPPVTYDSGSSARAIAAADFNGDGKLDLAVADNNSVSVFLGDGSGGFSAPVNYPVAFTPDGLAVGDFTNDGKPDIAVATNGGVICVLLGDGKGGFVQPATYPVGSDPTSVAVGDFNGDGIPDLIIANSASNTVSILLGNGNGTFGPASNYQVGSDPQAVAVGDFNGDGKLDLAVADSGSNSVSILIGNGQGGFVSRQDFSVGSDPFALAVGDFNNDGNLDLAVTNNQSGTVTILLGNGNGGFSSRKDISIGGDPRGIAVGDFNGDGKLDLAFADQNSFVSVLLGNGNGTFGAEKSFFLLDLEFSTAVAVADLNGDGKQDLVVVGASTVDVLLGNGNGTFSKASPSFIGGSSTFLVSLVVADFNGDGNLDVAVGSANSGNPVNVLLGDGTGNLGPPTGFITGVSGNAIAVGDFDGNGGPDLAVTNSGDNDVAILLNQAVATHFQVSLPSAATAESPFTLTVTALDGLNDTAIGYSGIVHFTSTDPNAVLPANVTLHEGVGTFSAMLQTTGSQSITATALSVTGSAGTVVAPDPTDHFSIGLSATSSAAGGGLVIAVTALDQSNQLTRFNGIVHFTSSDLQAQLPPDATLTDGVGFFAVTLKTAGNQTFTATAALNTSLTGPSSAVAVSAVAANHLVIRFQPNAITRLPASVTVTAEDPYGNTTTTYAGTLHFTSTDSAATLPPNSTLSGGIGVFSATFATSGNQTLTAIDAVSGLNGVRAAIALRGQMLTGLLPTPNGFAVTFDKPFNPATVTLYSAPDDVLLVNGAGNSVRGSLVLNTASGAPSDTSFTFVATSGVLPAGTYTVTLVSGPSGIKDSAGIQLDGTNSGIPGNNYVATFAVAATPSVVLSIPDFARGPASASNILLPNDTGSGIPITLTGAVNLTDLTFTLTFNSALLNISGTLNGPSGSFTLQSNSGGVASFAFQSGTPLSGSVTLGNIIAQVPNSAAASYKSKTLLHLGNIVINGGSTTATNNDGIEAVAYLGDVAGTGSFSPLDAALISEVAVNLTSGFAAYPQLDPAIIGDVSGTSRGGVDSADITLMNRLLAGIMAPQIPQPPSGLIIPATGPDPALSLPADLTVTPDGSVTVPVNIDTARPSDSSGMMEATLALRYDPQFFSVTASDIQLGTIPNAGTGWQLAASINAHDGRDRHHSLQHHADSEHRRRQFGDHHSENSGL